MTCRPVKADIHQLNRISYDRREFAPPARVYISMSASSASSGLGFRPAGMILNTGWIEHTGGDFYFYKEGFTDSVGRIIEAIDLERLEVAAALGVSARTMLQMSLDAGFIGTADLQKGEIAAAWRESRMPSGIKSPSTMMDRYILEDVSYGLVPISEFARLVDVPTPTIDAVVHLASLATGISLREVGLTLERMGLSGVSQPDLLKFLG